MPWLKKAALDSPLRLAFEDDIELSRLEIPPDRAEQLRVEAVLRSTDYHLLDRYSLAIHLIDARRDERVAQGDVGVGPGLFVPLYIARSTSARCSRATTKFTWRSMTGGLASACQPATW